MTFGKRFSMLCALPLLFFVLCNFIPEASGNPLDALLNGQSVSSGVSIELWEIDPDRFADNGHATDCNVQVVVNNRTQFHVSKITYRIGAWGESVPDVTAKTSKRVDFSVQPSDDSDSCAKQAEYIIKNVRQASIFDCVMEKHSEGECQDLVHVSTGIDERAVNILRKIEQDHIRAGNEALRKEKEQEATEQKAAIDKEYWAFEISHPERVFRPQDQFVVRARRENVLIELPDQDNTRVGSISAGEELLVSSIYVGYNENLWYHVRGGWILRGHSRRDLYAFRLYRRGDRFAV